MSYYDLFLLLHVYFFVQKWLHVNKCCKYFILSRYFAIKHRRKNWLQSVWKVSHTTNVGGSGIDSVFHHFS